MSGYEIVKRNPTPEEYFMLRRSVGWFNTDFDATKLGLDNSLFSVCAMIGEKIIGCGRIVGDGGIYFHIHDMIVLPEFQKRGVGSLIMDAIMNYFEENAHPNAIIYLTAAKGVLKFYEKYGFIQRPEDGPGMFMIWNSDSEIPC